jgi:hypothetical protein
MCLTLFVPSAPLRRLVPFLFDRLVVLELELVAWDSDALSIWLTVFLTPVGRSGVVRSFTGGCHWWSLEAADRFVDGNYFFLALALFWILNTPFDAVCADLMLFGVFAPFGAVCAVWHCWCCLVPFASFDAFWCHLRLRRWCCLASFVSFDTFWCRLRQFDAVYAILTLFGVICAFWRHLCCLAPLMLFGAVCVVWCLLVPYAPIWCGLRRFDAVCVICAFWRRLCCLALLMLFGAIFAVCCRLCRLTPFGAVCVFWCRLAPLMLFGVVSVWEADGVRIRVGGLSLWCSFYLTHCFFDSYCLLSPWTAWLLVNLPCLVWHVGWWRSCPWCFFIYNFFELIYFDQPVLLLLVSMICPSGSKAGSRDLLKSSYNFLLTISFGVSGDVGFSMGIGAQIYLDFIRIIPVFW